jgi:hypothetical protein
MAVRWPDRGPTIRHPVRARAGDNSNKREARRPVVTAVTSQQPAVQQPGPGGTAGALRAALPALPAQTSLSGAEQLLPGEWPDRLAADG